MTEGGLVVIGAGIAGMSAAIWCERLRIPLTWLEGSSVLGGQLLRINGAIPDYPGLEAENGREFLKKLVVHLGNLQLAPQLNSEVVKVEPARRLLTLRNGHCFRPDAVLLASGASPRRLEIPGEEDFRGVGVSDSATRDRHVFAGRAVAVVGGGDAALENALILAECCPQVFLVHRGTTFRGQSHFQAAVLTHPRIKVLWESQVCRILGAEQVQGIELAGPEGRSEISVGGVVVKVGVAANVGPWKGQLQLDDWGYIHVDASQRTSAHGVWAAGDVCNPKASSLVAAAGQAMVAVKSIASAGVL
ncbi:MAG: FAD-dependent oxidoreductase [Candidatus Sericytochromatia bacterium]|nr:FAD-dependent oxidoreductase [Candidatus Sericytochromatia bacterium]